MITYMRKQKRVTRELVTPNFQIIFFYFFFFNIKTSQYKYFKNKNNENIVEKVL